MLAEMKRLALRIRRRMSDDRGFTLMELLIVMAVLVILASVVIPRFAGRTEDARRSKAVSDLENIGVALDMYEADNGTYPTTEQGVDALFEPPQSDPAPTNWNGPYLKKRVTNDPWGFPYHYVSPGDMNPDSYDLASFGRDGQEGGVGKDADIVNWEQ
jgi:general secretion pathway protein G